MESIVIKFTINGKTRQIQTKPNKTLLSMLREDLELTGTKEGCGEGECGTCTVLLDGKPVNACLVLVGQVDGHDVLTIEGVASNGKLHPLQKAFINTGAIQCGFCSPGAILSALALLKHTPHPTSMEIQRALGGNLCRCTGYSKIVAAVQIAVEEMRREGFGDS
jgi:carbon-monoxide dehydrogenase small subunit